MGDMFQQKINEIHEKFLKRIIQISQQESFKQKQLSFQMHKNIMFGKIVLRSRGQPDHQKFDVHTELPPPTIKKIFNHFRHIALPKQILISDSRDM